MLIIIEGPDLAGKSTFASYLPNAIHFTQNEAHYMYEAELERAKTDLVVLDRCWISEKVYGPIKRQQCTYTDEEYDMLCNKLKAIPHSIFYVTSPVDMLLMRYNMRGEDYITQGELIEIANTYGSVMRDLDKRGLRIYEVCTSLYSNAFNGRTLPKFTAPVSLDESDIAPQTKSKAEEDLDAQIAAIKAMLAKL